MIPICRHRSWGGITSNCSLAFNYVVESIISEEGFKTTETNEFEERTYEIKQILRTRERSYRE
jgi:hypothetical protein